MHPNDIESIRILLNSEPVSKYHGLSINEMNGLLYKSFTEDCVVRLRHDIPDAVLDQIPIFRIAETLIRIVEREGSLRLTGKRKLNLKSCAEIYGFGFFPCWEVDEGFSKKVHEDNWCILYSARLVLQLSKLLKVVKGKLEITVAGKKRLSEMSRSQLFHEFFMTYAKFMNWAVNDVYPEWVMLQQLSGFPTYLLHLYGKEYQSSQFYFNHLEVAYPRLYESLNLLDGEANPDHVESCFGNRFFEALCMWFGFVESENKKRGLFRENHKYRTTSVFDAVFEFD